MASEKVETSKGQRKHETDFDFGDGLEDAVSRYGADNVFDYYRRTGRVALQGVIRAMLEDGATDEEINTRIADWKPGVKLAGEKLSAEEQLLRDLKGKSAEEQLAFLSSLKAKLTAAA